MASPRTLLGPLTTTWSPPPICSYFMALCDTCTTVWQAQTCNPSSKAHDFTDCWPPRSGDQATVDPGVMMGWGFYSPGIACPAGYTTAGVATSGASAWPGGVSLEYEMVSGETVAACCPDGFSITWIEATSTYAQTCVLMATASSFITVQCDSGTFAHFSTVDVPATVSGNILSSYEVYAPLIQLNYQSSDLPASTAATTSGTSSATSGSSNAASLPTSTVITKTVAGQTETYTSVFTPGSTSTGMVGGGGGISQGAKIGIGVGAGVGALLLATILFLCWRLRRREKTKPDSGSIGRQDSKKKNIVEAELGGQAVTELDGRPLYAELPTRLPSHRIPPRDNVFFRRSDQNWVISPGDGSFPENGLEPRDSAVFELEGDSTPRSTIDERRP